MKVLTDLPGGQARCTEQMSARLNAYVFVVLGTDLAQLERRTHLTVKLILLLCHPNVIFGCVMDQETEVCWYTGFAVRVQVTTTCKLLFTGIITTMNHNNQQQLLLLHNIPYILMCKPMTKISVEWVPYISALITPKCQQVHNNMCSSLLHTNMGVLTGSLTNWDSETLRVGTVSSYNDWPNCVWPTWKSWETGSEWRRVLHVRYTYSECHWEIAVMPNVELTAKNCWLIREYMRHYCYN